ncbi:RHS repeat-associated core domain-containing protein [Planomonospora venezuelensis]|uniref:RHS repeat-associated protein n=1 Tax=Planomonospora venezuelensis TaxID=1999 RepID=A0A841DBQ3_PLAVE|nr:RHS repeat-associated core domain-containing protein [Planomonospora venezuelensis]MBB5966197.1 RHS repeat-associated protein [Planomonospora venezuelensis]
MTSRTKGTSQQRFTYSGLSNDISVIADGSGAIQAKYGRDVAGGLLSMHEGGSLALAVMNDLHGDVVATFTGTALVDSTAYDPFGRITHTSGTKRSLGYQGEYTDPDSGKVNMHARWYQPGTGAFTSRDDWTLTPDPSAQANRYTYANASPLTGIDPTGHETINPINDGTQGYICGVDGICSETFVHAQWWSAYVTSPGYDYYNGPGFSDEEIGRLGGKYMSNGRLVPKKTDNQVIDFWLASKEAQNDFMSKYTPTLSNKSLSIMWAVTAAYHNQYVEVVEGVCVKIGDGGVCGYSATIKSANDGRSAMHRAADEFARQWARVKGPVWSDDIAELYIKFKLGGANEKAEKLVQSFKRAWVHAYRDVIKGAAAYFGVPALILAGVAFEELGGDPNWFDTAKRTAKEALGFFWNKRDLTTSFGNISMQIGVAAETLGYDKSKLSKNEADAIVKSLQNPASNIFIAAKRLADINAHWNRTSTPSGWTSQRARVVARDWNGSGPDAENYADRVMRNQWLVGWLISEG